MAVPSTPFRAKPYFQAERVPITPVPESIRDVRAKGARDIRESDTRISGLVEQLRAELRVNAELRAMAILSGITQVDPAPRPHVVVDDSVQGRGT